MNYENSYWSQQGKWMKTFFLTRDIPKKNMRSLCLESIIFSIEKSNEIDPLEAWNVLKTLPKRFREDPNTFRSSFHKVYKNVNFMKIESFHQNIPVDTLTDLTNLPKTLSLPLKKS